MSGLQFKDWNIETMTGYKPITTYYMDFSIADHFGTSAIKDTYNRALDYAYSDYKVLTELVMVLNWKIWEHYESNMRYATLYEQLFRELDEYAVNNLKGNELKYFYRTTD